MKKLLLLIGFATSGILCAASPGEKESLAFLKNTAGKFKKVSLQKYTTKDNIKFNGFTAYDTDCCGTCYQYGTYEQFTYGGVSIWQFRPASAATSSTVITPPCTGGGSYLG